VGVLRWPVKNPFTCLVLLAAFGEPVTLGQFVLSPVAVSEVGLGTFSPTAAPLHALIDGSGLDTPFVSGTTDFDTYFASTNANFSKNVDGTKWQSDYSFELPFTGTVDFDLGAPYVLTKAAIWNVSVKELAVQVATSTNGPWQDVGQFTLSDQQSSLSLRFTVLDFGATFIGRHVRLNVISEYPITPRDTFGYVTISEFVVRAAPAGGPPLTVALDSFGNVVLSFTGTLQSSAAPNGPFADVQGNPLGIHTIKVANLVSREFFRTRN
jgi:hypothetical protein